ncbi:MAG TPA: patatin-like phospholipase family protein [Acidimicrobiales bacterium]|nr:patatin-like phospholipase family protein [Acidimicrobiales bacterium]
MRIGLVLGGGGVVGVAYHAGALSAIAHDWDWDPRTADLIVGTSAGSIVGALLRSGIPAHDLAAALVGAEVTEADPATIAAARGPSGLPPVGWATFVRWPRLPSAGLLRSAVRRPWRIDPLTAVAALVPDGKVDLAAQIVGLSGVLGEVWPERRLWLTAVRERDLRRVAFGRGDRFDAPLASAVAASCAVPGYFAPVPIGADRFVDGGVRSPTNADLLRGEPIDLAIVIAPMSARSHLPGGVDGLMRGLVRRRVRAEVDALRAAGIPTVLIEPGPRVITQSGTDLMDDGRTLDVVREAFLDTGEQLQAPFTRALMAGLAPRLPRSPGPTPTGAGAPPRSDDPTPV